MPGLGAYFDAHLAWISGGVEDAVGTEPAVGQSLRAVFESIGQRIAAFVGHAEDQLVLHQIELYDAGLRGRSNSL